MVLRERLLGALAVSCSIVAACGDDGAATGADAATDGMSIDASHDAGTPRPVDLIVVMDNSSGQDAERAAFEAQLQQALLPELTNLGVDHRTILLTAHGADASDVCIGEPLGVPNCGGAPAASAPFFHYSTQIASHDGWCKILGTFTQIDEFGLEPGGWKAWLRGDSLKAFIYIGNDGVECDTYDDNDVMADGITTAGQFDSALLALDGTLFGVASNRSYVWLSVVGVEASGGATTPIPADAPVSMAECAGAVAAGTGHQALSVLTGGERYSWCEFAGQAAGMLEQMAADIAAHR